MSKDVKRRSSPTRQCYQIPTVSKALPQPPRRSLCGCHPHSHASPMPIVGVKPVMVACARSRNAWVKAHVFAGDWVVFTLHGGQAILTVKYWHRHSLGFHLPSWVCQGATCLLKLVLHRVTTKSIAGAACEVGGAVDCLLGEWGAWSTCDVSWVWQFSTWRQFPVLSPVILLRWVDSWMFETWRCFHGYVGGSNCTWVAVGSNDQIWRNWPECRWIFNGHC